MEGHKDTAVLLGEDATCASRCRHTKIQESNNHLMQWLVVLVAMLLLTNIMMMGMFIYGFTSVKAEVARISQRVDGVVGTFESAAETFGNFTSNVQLLPESVFDFAVRVMTLDYVDFASKVQKVASLIAKTQLPPPDSPTGYVFQAASLVSGFASAVMRVPEVQDPLPPYSGPVDLPDFAVFRTLEWVQNQTDPVKMQRSGEVCVDLLNNVNTAFTTGVFNFNYYCQTGGTPVSPPNWATCTIALSEKDVEPYIGPLSPFFQICDQLRSISPSFFLDL